MTNEYDDLLATPAEEANDYDAMLQAQAGVDAAARRSSLIGAVETNPDQYARAQELSRSSGVPPEVVHRNLPEIERRVQVNEYDNLLQSSPTLAAQVADPEFAKVAHDDLSLLAQIGNSFARGWRGLKQMVPAIQAAGNANVLAEMDRIDRGEQVDPEQLSYPGIWYLGAAPERRAELRREWGGQARRELADQVSRVATLEAEKRARPAAPAVQNVVQAQSWGEALRAFGRDPLDFLASSGPESLVQSTPGIVGGGALTAFTRNPMLGAEAVGAGSFAVDFANSLMGYLEVDPADSAAVQAALADPKRLQRAMDKAAKHASVVGLFDMASAGLASKVPQPAVQAVVQPALGAAGEAGGQLAAEEQLQPGQILAEAAGELVGAPAEVASANAHRLQSAINITAQRLRPQREKAEAAVANAQKLGEVAQRAADSKLRRRSPETFQQFLEAAGQDSDVQDVYVDGNALAQVLNQAGVDPSQVSPAVATQIAQAVQTGGDVRIPLAEFSARIAAEPYAAQILPHLRVSPEAMSAVEAETFMQSEAEAFRAEVEKAVAEQEQQDAHTTSAMAVEADVLRQLGEVNRFAPDVNSAYATLLREFYATTAQQLGVTPEALYQRYPLRLQAEPLADGANTLEQRVPLSAEDQEIEARFAQALGSDGDATLAAYAQIEGTEGGRLLNTDLARELSEDYRANRNKSAAVHEPASTLVKELYARRLAQPLQEGEEPLVVFTAGGTGAGKTTGLQAVRGLNPTIDRAQIIYDTNMNTLESAVQKIEQALAADRDVEIIYTYRDPVEALVHGALTRAMRMERELGTGRTVPLVEHARTHSGSFDVMRQVAERYKDDPRVTLRVVDNSRGKGNAAVTTLDRLPQIDYNSLAGNLNDAFEAQRAAGSISEAVYAATRDPGAAQGAQPGEGRPDGQGDRGRLAQGHRGQIAFGSDITKAPSVITLLRNADLSTFLHESGHFFLEVYSDIAAHADAPPQVVGDMQALLEWFGVKDLVTWRAMSIDQRREAHEKFARGFESYLFEGKAPSPQLASLFQRFRAWLLNVYRSLTALNVELSDEVRGVMSRMLATRDQIRAAEAAQNYAPLFATPDQGGMTADEWQRYQDLGAEATRTAAAELEKRSLRDMRYLTNARSRVLKRLQQEAAAKRAAVRDEVAAEVRAEPIYAAQRFISRGELEQQDQNNKQRKVTELAGMVGTKLSIPALQEMYGDGAAAPWRYLTSGRYGQITAHDGLHPDLVAELFGFTSGDELVRELLAATPEQQEIEARTDRRVLERYGDLTDDAAMERAVDEEIHNEARSRFAATELRAIDRAMNARQATGEVDAKGRKVTVNVLTGAARAFAEESIARKRVRDVKPAQFKVAEARASRAAQAAMAEGKLPEAAMEKRNQLINGYALRAATEALAEVDRGVEYLKKFGREGTRKALDADYLDQIDQLLERFDLRRGVSDMKIDKRKSLVKWIEAQQALGFEPVIDDKLLLDARRQHYREMTVEEFRGLIDAVKNIEHLARLKQTLLTAKDKREFAAAVADAEASIRANARGTVPERLESNTFSAHLEDGVDELLAMHRKMGSLVRQMDGFKDGGAMWELFIRPMNAAGDAEAAGREKATKALSALFKPILNEGKLRQKMFIPAIGRSLSREGRLAVALNWGNETNRARILEGEKWSPAQAQAVLGTLTKQEWDFAQGIWDYIDSYWPEIAAKEKRVTGVVPEKVSPSAVQTPHGEYRGGYYPIKYDPNRSTRAEADTLAESVRQAMQGLYTRATTRRGHTKARVDSVQRPVRKDLGVIFEHVDQVVHDLSWHEYLIDANRLLRAGAIDSAIREHYGPAVLRAMRGALDDMAAGEQPAQNAFERSINYLRSGTSVAGLGWNLATSLLQPFGLTQSMVRIGPKWIARGLTRWLGDATRMQNTAKFIYEKSDFMRLRGLTQQREISEIRNQVATEGKLSAVRNSYFYLIQKGQQIVDIPTWLGAYEKAMDTAPGDEARAIALADQAVLDSQGGGQVKDLAAIQRGGPLQKLWTNFYSFFNTTYNLSVESVRRTDFKKPADIGRLAVDFLLLYTIPAALGTLLKSAFKGDDDDLPEKLVRDQLGYMLGTMVGLRELGSAVSGFDYTGPTGARFFSEVAKLAKQIEQGEADEAFWKRLNAVAGILFHYPAGQVQRTAEGVAAMVDGQTANPGVLVSGPPQG